MPLQPSRHTKAMSRTETCLMVCWWNTLSISGGSNMSRSNSGGFTPSHVQVQVAKGASGSVCATHQRAGSNGSQQAGGNAHFMRHIYVICERHINLSCSSDGRVTIGGKGCFINLTCHQSHMAYLSHSPAEGWHWHRRLQQMVYIFYLSIHPIYCETNTVESWRCLYCLYGETYCDHSTILTILIHSFLYWGGPLKCMCDLKLNVWQKHLIIQTNANTVS